MQHKDIKKLIKILKTIDIVRKESVTLKYAGDSAIYIDIKKAYGYPEALVLMCKLMMEKIDGKIDCIASGGYGGLPLAGAMAVKFKLKLALIREKPKSHGRNVWIDGYVPKADEKVWVVDDVFTTGNSLKQIIKTLKSTKAEVVGCSVVVRRGIGKIALPCKHLMTIEDLVINI